MENLVISLNVVLPLFLLIALGYVLKKFGMYDVVTLKTMNKLVFKVFLPVYLFHSIYSTDLSAVFDIKVILFAGVGLLLWFLLLMCIVPLLEKDNAKRGVMVQAMFRSNFVLFGLPVAISLCGEDRIGTTSLLLGIIIPIYNAQLYIEKALHSSQPKPKAEKKKAVKKTTTKKTTVKKTKKTTKK